MNWCRAARGLVDSAAVRVRTGADTQAVGTAAGTQAVGAAAGTRPVGTAAEGSR